MATSTRAQVALSTVLLSALATSGCAVFGGSEPREFCVVAVDIVDLESADAFTSFAEVFSAPALTDAFAVAASDAANAASDELTVLAGYVTEAAANAPDESAMASFESASTSYVALATVLTDSFGDVSTADEVPGATADFSAAFQVLVDDPAVAESFTAVDEIIYSECGLTSADPAEVNSAAAKSDVATLGKEIATYAVDSASENIANIITTANGMYLLEGEEVAEASADVDLVYSNYVNATDWCVEVRATVANETWSYSSFEGLTDKTCSEISVG